MENQHRKIEGYAELDQETIDLMNEIKQAGQAMGELVAKLQQHPNVHQRWVAIGATHLQQGGMALTRSVANPTFFF